MNTFRFRDKPPETHSNYANETCTRSVKVNLIIENTHRLTLFFIDHYCKP